jgi:multisubunit Na+/H+ antiporter MnhB subunit
MSLIVKTVARLAVSFITVFGIYIVLYGHVSPGGGFAGGTILAAGLILLLLAFGRERTRHIVTHDAVMTWDSAGALGFLAVAALGYVAGGFFFNFLSGGHPYHLASAGTIPLSNVAIGAKVGAGLFGMFWALAAFRSVRRWEE